jgi:excisionase family DNA binding protein
VDNPCGDFPTCQTGHVPPRFYLLADVAELLNVSAVQARALVTSGELPAIQVGGRGQWRVEATELEAYIQRKYAETRSRIEERKRMAAGDPGASTSTDDADDL